MIGIAFSVVAVTVAIQATQDSGRDRTRTTEIHAAESALDVAIMSLEDGFPCTIADTVIGGGASAIDVHTIVEYFNSSKTPLTTCVSGQILGTPTTAVVTTVATPHNPGIGIAPSRTIKANVNIKPVEVESTGSAIFSSGAFSTGAGFTVGSVNPGDQARVWIDSGNWTCNTNVTINGDLVVANGSVSFQNASCTVTGDVWARTQFKSCCTPSATYSVGGNLTVFLPASSAFGLELSNKNRFGGNVSIGGVKGIKTGTQWTNTTVAGSVCSANVGGACSALTDNPPMGFPVINYTPADFTGFTLQPASEFAQATLAAWGFTPSSWQYSTILAQPCSPPGYMSTTPIRLPKTGNANTIYNCTGTSSTADWGSGSGGGVVTLKLYADIVIYARSFSAPNGLTITSGDGQPHNIFMIVPSAVSGLSGYTSGNIGFTSGGIQVVEPVAIFLYTPKTLNFPNTSTTRGQMYAGAVTVGAGSGVFKFYPMPLPNGYLSVATTVNSGFTVEVVSKHEE
jgi:hypothetical protein